jgi:hypothetical protein
MSGYSANKGIQTDGHCGLTPSNGTDSQPTSSKSRQLRAPATNVYRRSPWRIKPGLFRSPGQLAGWDCSPERAEGVRRASLRSSAVEPPDYAAGAFFAAAQVVFKLQMRWSADA